VSELRSAVETLRAEVLAGLPDARIEEDFAELQRVGDLIEAERLRRLAELERRRVFDRDGYLSAAAWLVGRFRVAPGAARVHARVARALEEMPRTRLALEEGEVTMSAVRVLVEAREADPEAFARSEGHLVEAARLHPVGDLQRVAAYWRESLERARALEGEDRLRARRRLHASLTFLGTVRVDGDLDPETGETLLAALNAVLDAEARARPEGDERTPAQRRADALGEICRQWLDLAERPTVAGERPHVTVTVPVEMLRASRDVAPWPSAAEPGGGPTAPRDRAAELGGGSTAPRDRAAELGGGSTAPRDRAAELDRVGPVSVEAARRLACDASVMRVVLGGRSEPLDVGRRSHVVPPSIRRAVIVRDRRCRFPGCDRPHTWCDAHRVVHWADGGPTSLSNLVLLCRRHHRLIHRPRGFGLEMVDGRPVFRRPDGSFLQEDRAPP
jgi:hypothetical protein